MNGSLGVDVHKQRHSATSEVPGIEPQSQGASCQLNVCPCEAECVQSSLSGDGDAYARLVRRHQQHVAARMWRFTRTRADHSELVQDVFVEAFLSLHTYRGDAPFEHWLARISTAVGYRHWRSKAKAREHRSLPVEELRTLAAEEPERMNATEAADTLHSLMDQLPPRDRLVLMLRYVEDRTLEETAQLTGWSVAMVKVQAWRARSKLKELFRKAGLEVGS